MHAAVYGLYSENAERDSGEFEGQYISEEVKKQLHVSAALVLYKEFVTVSESDFYKR